MDHMPNPKFTAGSRANYTPPPTWPLDPRGLRLVAESLGLATTTDPKAMIHWQKWDFGPGPGQNP